MARAIELVEAAAERLKELAAAEHGGVVAGLQATQDKAVDAARGKHQPKIDSVEERRAYLQEQMVEKHRISKERVAKRKTDELNDAEEENWATRAAVEGKFEDDVTEAEDKHRERMHDLQESYDHAWRELTERWRGGIAALCAEFAALCAADQRHFPAWESPDWQERPPVAEVPRGLRIGDFAFDLAKIPDGVPRDARLKLDQPLQGRLPSFAGFPERCALLLKARDQGRSRAVQALQALMLRFLTAVPPGKVRFTIIDPVGLGENFAAFMHLADYDELLVDQPHLDRADAHRAAAGRPDRPHGKRDPEVPAQPVQEHRGVQRRRPARWPSRSACWSSPTSRPTSPPRRPAGWSASSAAARRCGVYHADQRRCPSRRCRTASNSPIWNRRAPRWSGTTADSSGRTRELCASSR